MNVFCRLWQSHQLGPVARESVFTGITVDVANMKVPRRARLFAMIAVLVLASAFGWDFALQFFIVGSLAPNEPQRNRGVIILFIFFDSLARRRF